MTPTIRCRVSLAVASLALASGCSGGSSGNQVAMVPGRAFDPATITIRTGETVAWVNEAEDAHTVTAYQVSVAEGATYFSTGGFKTEAEARDNLAEALIGEGGTYQVTFERPGTYEYFCIPHEGSGMKGTVEVED